MGSRIKEEEKNEKAIRGLLRKPPNSRCINCNSRGPQYVCLNFWTFVCTQCSGIHREFTHRVKSVSMSKFTSQEVSNLENGGNERARETYFKDWDPQRQPLPDSSNVDRLRDFIKNVYVDKRFSGERPLPRGRGGDRDRDETNESRRPDLRPYYDADSRSPPYEDRYEERPSGGRRSNVGYEDRRYEERGGRYDDRRSPGRFETDRSRYNRNYSDNRRYDDRGRYENRDRQYEDRYNEGLDRRFEERFTNERRNPQNSRDYAASSPPPIRPVREILGDDVPPLRVEDHGSQTNGGRESDRSHRSQDGRGQRFGSSSSFGSVDGNVPVVAPAIKRENSASLIDFLAEPEAPVAREQPDPFGLTPGVQQPTASMPSSTGWATFEMFASASASVPAAAAAAAPAPASVVPGGFNNLTTQTNGNAQWAPQWPVMPNTSVSPSVESSTDSWSSLVGPSIPAANSQPWSPFSMSSTPTSGTSLSAGQPLATQDSYSANPSTASETRATPAQPPSRPAIPEDLFTAPPTTGLQFSGAPFAPQYTSLGGMGMLVGNYGQAQKTRNPFDPPGEPSSASVAAEFPSMSTLQAALPNLSMGSMSMPGPGLGGLGPQWTQTNMAPPLASYPAAAPSGGLFIGQQIPNTMPQTMRPGPMGHSMGIGLPGSYPTGPKQSVESFLPVQGPPQVSSQNSFGAALDPSYAVQWSGPRVPFQNTMGPSGGMAASSDFLFSGQAGQRLISQSSLGTLSSIPGTEPHFPGQGPQFPTRTSSGPVGNPFG